MAGRGVQVVHVEGNRYRLDDELERILLRDDIKDLPVAVVSVAGASRCGKSILLNFFLRYLSAPVGLKMNMGKTKIMSNVHVPPVPDLLGILLSKIVDEYVFLGQTVQLDRSNFDKEVARRIQLGCAAFLKESKQEDGSWIGDDYTELQGFVWRVGIIKTTSGIVLWSEPFIITTGTGERIALLLMDTEGTFDGLSNSRDSAAIFGLSSLISSLQIYNITPSIEDGHLQNLKLFTEYGKMSHDQGAKALQEIEFLVRDWPSANELEYGFNGGKIHLEEKLRIRPEQVEEMQKIREQIRCSYKSASCFLLPSPGREALSNTFNGKNGNIDVQFKIYIKQLTANLFAPSKLKPKEVNGLTVKASELLTYVKTYMVLFNRGVPTADNIMQATAAATKKVAFEEARRVYQTGMEAECGPGEPCLHPYDLEERHAWHRANAFATYNSKRNTNSTCDLGSLREAINEVYDQIIAANRSKYSRALQAGITAYNDYMASAWNPDRVCLHPADLDQEHRKGERRALAAFRGSQVNSVMFSFDTTEEHENRLFEVVRANFAILKRGNDSANSTAVDRAFNVFVTTMQNSAASYSKLLMIPELVNYCKYPFVSHAKREAHEKFYASRRGSDNPARDFYLDRLDSKISEESTRT